MPFYSLSEKENMAFEFFLTRHPIFSENGVRSVHNGLAFQGLKINIIVNKN